MPKPKAFKDDVCVCCGECVPKNHQAYHVCGLIGNKHRGSIGPSRKIIIKGEELRGKQT